MRVSAEFDELETAVGAMKALLQNDVQPENIEIRSSYPLFEEPLPKHRHRPMRIRNLVRCLWVCGAIGGFSLAAYPQLEYPIRTGGLPYVPIPTNCIIAYECAQITALIMTAVFFFMETRTFRMRPIPHEEDLAVSTGAIAVVVDGPLASQASGILESQGARLVRTFASWALCLLLLGLVMTQSGCTVRMRGQVAVKDSKSVNAPFETGIVSMPSEKDSDLAGVPEPYGRMVSPSLLATYKKRGPFPKLFTPPELKNIANPAAADAESMRRAHTLFEKNCQFCHGVEGHGDGKVAPVYAPPPANLTRADLVKASDGDLFWTVTVAPTTMPPFGTRMPARDRFAIVRYVRVLQGKAPVPPAAALSTLEAAKPHP